MIKRLLRRLWHTKKLNIDIGSEGPFKRIVSTKPRWRLKIMGLMKWRYFKVATSRGDILIKR